MRRTQTTGNAGLGLLGVIGVVLIILRAFRLIGWSWWAVTAPIWVPLIGLPLLFFIAWGCLAISERKANKKEKK